MKIRERINLAAGILFTLIIGTLLHFTYEWSGENPFVALYSPVNESVWEHLKLLFFPVLLYTFFEIIVLYKTSGHFLTSRLLAVCIGMFFIASAFFTYTGLLGRDFLALDILIFIFSVLLTFFLLYGFGTSTSPSTSRFINHSGYRAGISVRLLALTIISGSPYLPKFASTNLQYSS